MASAGVITAQRFSWMGYNGAQTEEIDLQLLRADPAGKDNYQNYARRQQVIAAIKERLYLIKRELDLVPEEEMREERERHERRRAERERRAAEQRAAEEEEERRRLAEETARYEEKQRALNAANDAAAGDGVGNMKFVIAPHHDHGDSDADSEGKTEMDNQVLEEMTHTPQELSHAVACLSAGVRCILLGQNAGYVSYVDGSTHTSLTRLERHNATHTNGANPTTAAQEFGTEELHSALEAYNNARQRLDLHRARADATYSTRLRASERAVVSDDAGDEDETALLTHVQVAHNSFTEVRLAYNRRAAQCGSVRAPPATVHVSAPEDINSLELAE